MRPDEIATVTDPSGPLAGAVTELVAKGWHTLPAPAPRRPQQQLVLLIGVGGVLVIGTHKSTDTALAEFAAVVTALLPTRLRRAVVCENGHDLRSLPQLALERPASLDDADVREAASSLAEAARPLLTVAEVLDATRDAQPEPRTRGLRSSSRRARLTGFLGRNAVAVGLIVAAILIAVLVSTASDDRGAARFGVSTSSSGQESAPSQSSTSRSSVSNEPPTAQWTYPTGAQ